jgi:NAD(P)-dependent dehydrogenase (short-subunit alcohol dehydrogenase family)
MSARSTRRSKTARPLDGRIAVVAGATRGAGRGIARALAEAGALVYCTGRSVAGQPSPYKRPETIAETAEMIAAAGGKAVAIRVDHTDEREVRSLFRRIEREHGRLDILVDSVAGESPLMGQWGSFWKVDLSNADAIFRQSLISHMITAKYAAPLMIRRSCGLIVEITENDALGGGGSPPAQAVKLAVKAMALNMATELKPHGVAAIAVTPGFLRSEAMLDHYRVTERNWRDHGKKDKNFLESESPLYVGRAVAALAADPNVMARTGQLYGSWELARAYKFTDYDGRRPDWGRWDIDFSNHGSLLDIFRTGLELQLAWLTSVAARTKTMLGHIPNRGTSKVRSSKVKVRK